MNEHIKNLEQKLIQLHNDTLNQLSLSASADKEKDSNRNLLNGSRVKTVQEVQRLTNLIHSLYEQQHNLETTLEKEYKEKCEKLGIRGRTCSFFQCQ